MPNLEICSGDSGDPPEHKRMQQEEKKNHPNAPPPPHFLPVHKHFPLIQGVA